MPEHERDRLQMKYTFAIISEELTFYEIKIQAFNEVGAGNSSLPVIARTQQSSSPDKTLSSAAVIGVVLGAILFFILLLIILFFVRRKILKVQHAKSVRVRLNIGVFLVFFTTSGKLEVIYICRFQSRWLW